MKSHLTVLVNNKADRIESQLIHTLEKFRWNETTTRPDQTYYWNSWHYYNRDEQDDKELKQQYPNESDEVLRNACFVNNLPGNYETSALICPEGRWWDLLDSGWSLEAEPSNANDKAYWRWTMTLKSVFNQYNNCIAVQLVVDNYSALDNQSGDEY